ncbi:S8 family serine peptidase [Bacteriovorax sp. DB6_IX]|uniref:S8 family serine peptidase n=1 Tax=Bacteriovorax sp. DB6_IX TaxID=1353530 RepID=UPI00038A442D|nr:S8 family serine peptidase [Bacteriovorax sp. DB6_IX]EQC50521.1 peptidase, S8/S53 family [Bacteriovorax sp. DB6_IX]
MTLKLLASALVMGALQVNAANIAIIDSGTDMKHELIAPKAWINPLEIADNGRDEDRNGYQDDIHGWNFAESNSQVIDYSYLGTLNDDIKKFFSVQAKAIRGTVSEEELTWMRAKVQDQEFIKKLSIYGNFMHGTHVAGISARMSDESKILAAKLIPTEVKLPFMLGENPSNKGFIEKLVKKGIDLLASQQMTMMEEIAAYVDSHKMTVANGSFGTGYPQAKMIVETVYKQVLRKDPSEEDVKKYATYFISSLVKHGSKMLKAAPKTLFVFAAGNDGLDNDVFGTSPANLKGDNVITVAATIDYDGLAPFSNYGKKMVDIAAPGVAIRSAAPGNEYIEVSGTSQAAPFVAGVAGRILDINPELTPLEVKMILKGTVDKKDFLLGKVTTSGIVNTDRAVRAATLSLKMNVADSVNQAKIDILDMPSKKSFVTPMMIPGMIQALPSNFKL